MEEAWGWPRELYEDYLTYLQVEHQMEAGNRPGGGMTTQQVQEAYEQLPRKSREEAYGGGGDVSIGDVHAPPGDGGN